MGELLLYLALVDLCEFSDDELRDYLELMLGSLMARERTAATEALQEELFCQLEASAPDRKTISVWYQEYPDLLPDSVADLPDRLEEFDTFLEALFEDERLEEDPRLDRFRDCLELLADDAGWQQRSQAARGLAGLEEELGVHRRAYLAVPKTMQGCTTAALIAHMNLMEGFEMWQTAFRKVHKGKLEEALDSAFEGTCLFHATELWPAQVAVASA